MKEQIAPVVVLGAGLQGSCTALELARCGLEVTLVDQDDMPMNRASLRNEGKIHLGLVYANDRTLATAKLQLQGALAFRSCLARWLGPEADRLHCATPFHYLVANDSLLNPEELAEHYARVESLYSALCAQDPRLDYLGTRPERLYRRLASDELESHFRADQFQAGFATAEMAIDTDQLATLVRKAIADSPNIRFIPSRTVKAVERKNGLLKIEGVGSEGTWQMAAKQIVNATWESRHAIDRTLGLESAGGLVHRLKYRVIAQVPESLRDAPSVTIVIGPYGDVVIRPDGTAYLSWYPLALRGWSHDLQPPDSWNAACRGEVDEADAKEFSAKVIEAIDAWYPGIGLSEPVLVDAGAIVAFGRTDVDDAGSGLHDRTRIGVTSVDGYHSLDSGKLTTAPLFAKSAAERVMNGSKAT